MLEKIGIWILTKVVPGPLKKVWERVKNRHQRSKNDSHDYIRSYKKRHGQLIVTCVGMDAARSLDDIYVDVQFLDKRRAATYGSTEDIEKAFRARWERYSDSTSDERQDGMRVANNEQYLMVLGGPAVGKSTFLRKVGLEALKRENGDFEHECTPVFLELKRFTEDEIAIEALIVNEFKVCGYPYSELIANDKLEAGELLILFDGLDEVPTPNVHNVINKIKDFVDQYSQNRFIVSLRVGAYTGGFTEFAVAEIADFDDSQIQDYINNWFASGAHRKMKTSERCWDALNAIEYRSIKALAQNPLSLALLCTIYEESQSFPPNRSILYERILRIFLKKWTVEKHVRRDPPVSPYLDIPTIKEMLSEIAAENFKANRFFFSEDELIDQIQEFYQRRTNTSSKFDASGILDTILVDPGLFVERANGIYSFFHLTFQEHLTANHFVRTQSIHRLVSDHLHDDRRWQEVFLFAVQLMPQADNLLVAMEAEAAKFINTPGLKALLRWAEGITDTPDDRYNGSAKRLFALRQYLLLRLLDKVHKTSKYKTKRSQDLCLYLDLHEGDFSFYDRDLYLNCDLNLDSTIYRDLNLDIDMKLFYDQCFSVDHDPYPDNIFYYDFYLYVDTSFFSGNSTELGDRFHRELDRRIVIVKRMEQMEIFTGIDLQQMVRRFSKKQAFIKAAWATGSVEPPGESIHNTWLSVLGITDEMLAISYKEMEGYSQYLRAVKLIIACKEAAGSVSPDTWQQIEDRFLTVDAADFKN